jgi:hypothetical protein
LTLSYESAMSASHLPAIFEGATRLANTLRPEFGFVHLFWLQEPARESYNFGYRLQARDLDSVGIGNVHARTWFGPYLIELIGRPLLLGLPSAVEMVWGGIEVDLVAKPWLADADTLWEAQNNLMKQLRARGVVGTFKGPPMRWKPGPRWVSPGWERRKRR